MFGVQVLFLARTRGAGPSPLGSWGLDDPQPGQQVEAVEVLALTVDLAVSELDKALVPRAKSAMAARGS